MPSIKFVEFCTTKFDEIFQFVIVLIDLIYQMCLPYLGIIDILLLALLLATSFGKSSSSSFEVL